MNRRKRVPKKKSKPDPHVSLVEKIKIASTRRLKKLSLKQAWSLDFLDSGESEVNPLYKSIIKEFSAIRKTDGLIIGTNEVLRLLEKEQLAAVFVFKNKVSFPIKTCLFRICKVTGVPFIWLENQDNHTFDKEFPKSITYGIKKESLATLEVLSSLLLELSEKRNKDTPLLNDVSLDEMETEENAHTEENTNIETFDGHIFHHTHKKQISKKSNSKETGFLPLNTFSTHEKEIDFLDYESAACSGVLSIR